MWTDKLKLAFAAMGVKREGNNFAEFFTAKRWLVNNKMLLHRMGVKLWEAECYLELYAFNFDTLEEDFERFDNKSFTKEGG